MSYVSSTDILIIGSTYLTFLWLRRWNSMVQSISTPSAVVGVSMAESICQILPFQA